MKPSEKGTKGSTLEELATAETEESGREKKERSSIGPGSTETGARVEELHIL